MFLLFDSVQAAQEVAYMLYGQWDGCNGVIISKVDITAVQVAANLVDAKWCLSKEKCMLLIFINKKIFVTLILDLAKILFMVSLPIGLIASLEINFGQRKEHPKMPQINQSLIRLR